MKTLTTLACLLAALAFAPAAASAQGNAQPAPKQGKSKAQKNAQKASDEQVVALGDMHATPYDCDLGDKLTIYKKPGDEQEIALQWRKRTHRLTRMPTSTGAERFEDKQSGLVWIGIPAKGMLLDSKKGRQLANECRNDAQKRMLVQN